MWVDEVKTSEVGIKFISRNEWVIKSPRCGWNAEKQLYFPYKDYKGFPTMGIGHLIRQSTEDFNDGLTEERVFQLFASDLLPVERAIDTNIKVSLTQNRFDALVDFGFNLGIGDLRQEKNTFIRLLNLGRYDEVARIDPQGKTEGLILEWCHSAGTFDPNLLRRREAEARIWCTPYPNDHQASDDSRESYLAGIEAILTQAPQFDLYNQTTWEEDREEQTRQLTTDSSPPTLKNS